MSGISKYDGCFVEACDGGWQVCDRDGHPLEPVFDNRAAAEQACSGWQKLADQFKELGSTPVS